MTASSTADPDGAPATTPAPWRGRASRPCRRVPAHRCGGSPAGRRQPTTLIWDETIAAGGYAARRLDRGARLRLIDLGRRLRLDAGVQRRAAGRAAERRRHAQGAVERLSGGRPAAAVRHGPGAGEPVEDTAGPHDAFCGASNQASNARKYGDGDNYGAHPNARDRFLLGVAKFGLGRKDIHPCSTVQGRAHRPTTARPRLEVGPFAPGRHVTLRAEMDVIVVLANCPHVLDPRPDYTVTPVRARPGAARSPRRTIPSATRRPRACAPSSTSKTTSAGEADMSPDPPTLAGPSRARRGGRRSRALDRRSCAGPDPAHRRPGGQPGRRLPVLQRGRRRRALQRPGHHRRAGQHLPADGLGAALQRGRADDDRDRRPRSAITTPSAAPACESQHPALRPPHQGQHACGDNFLLAQRALRAAASATWSPTSTCS